MEKIKINSNVKTILKIIFVSIVLVFIIKEFSRVLRDFDLDLFMLYKDKLTLINLFIIALLGIISYIPLSFYDFILKKKVGIKLKNTTLYKFSWIASSLSSLLGFGGASSLAFKQYFYNEHVDDKKLLFKEIGKIVVLNLTGLSLLCLIYIPLNFHVFVDSGLIKYPMLVVSAYAPVIIGISLYRFIKDKNVTELFSTLLTIFISFLEWITTVILIYATLRITGANIGLIDFLSIYIHSAIIGIISLVPGGLGTFDLSFITGLSTFNVAIEQSLLVIILYRISYYIVPAAIGILLFINDFGKKLNKKLNNLPKQILSTIFYNILVITVFLSGVVVVLYNIAPEILVNVKILKYMFGSKLHPGLYISFNITLGFVLILLSRMLKYKSKGVYLTTIIILVLSALLSIVNKAGMLNISFLLIVSCITYLSRNSFYRKSFILTWRNMLKDLMVFLISFTTYFTILSHCKTYDYYMRFSKLLHRSGRHAIILITVTYVALYFINKNRKVPSMKFDECAEDVEEIINKYKGTSLTHLIYLKDKYIYLNEAKDVLFQYEIFADKLFVLGNPIGNKDKLFNEIENFRSFADVYGYTPIFYQVDEDMITYLHSNGYNFIKVGEESKVNVEEFNVTGSSMKSLRSSRNKMVKNGYTFDIAYPPFSNEFLRELKDISDEWLDDRKEKGYSIGFFDESYLNKAPIAIVKDADNQLKAFATIMNMYDNHETFSVDLMRFKKDADRGLMDFIFINLIELGKENGYKYFNMGVAPLSNVGTSKYAFLGEKVALYIYEYGQFLYSFKGLRTYKEKYAHQWNPKFIAYSKKVSLPLTMLQAALLCSRIRKTI